MSSELEPDVEAPDPPSEPPPCLDESSESLAGTSESSASVTFPTPAASPGPGGSSPSAPSAGGFSALDAPAKTWRSITDPGNLGLSYLDEAATWHSLPVASASRWLAVAPVSRRTVPGRRCQTLPSLGVSSVRKGSKDTTPSLEFDIRAHTLMERTHATSVLWASQLGRAVSGTLHRHVASHSSSVVPMQRCNICLDVLPASRCVVPRACGRQAHSVCLQCMTMYISMRIEEGRVTELWCPCSGVDDCDAKVTDGEVEQWMPEALVEKYRRFQRMRENANLRACPGCNELCKPELRKPEEANSPVIPEMKCGTCGCEFCFYHSNAHAVGPAACAEHERGIVKQERKALAKINTHKCPNCGVLTEKLSGCNHMTCQCKCQWCWVCGKEIVNVGWHYHPLKPLSCAQYNEKTAPRDHIRLKALMLCTKILTWPSAVVAALFVFLCPFAFIAAVVAQLVPICLCCGCCLFYCICFRDTDVEDPVKVVLSLALGFTFLVVGLPFLVFCLAWCLVAFPLWLLLLPLGARSEHLMILACAPMMTLLASMECFAPEAE